MFWLVMQTRTGGERRFQLRRGRTVIGCDPQTCLRIALPNVARRHCELLSSDDGLQLHHLAGDHQTLLNDVAVVETAVIRHGDRITIAGVTLEVRMEREAASAFSVEIQTSPAARQIVEGTPDAKTTRS